MLSPSLGHTVHTSEFGYEQAWRSTVCISRGLRQQSRELQSAGAFQSPGTSEGMENTLQVGWGRAGVLETFAPPPMINPR